MKIHHTTHYASRIANPTMAQLFAANISQLGEKVEEPLPNERMGSSDMGNVSQQMPAIHPYVTIVDPGVSAHTPRVCRRCRQPSRRPGVAAGGQSDGHDGSRSSDPA
ncbi:MAG: M20 family metallopeptidase [Caldilineaceae bacterium]|nr:M20 family metallopeptidase [Caldilineaceae bacterium]